MVPMPLACGSNAIGMVQDRVNIRGCMNSGRWDFQQQPCHVHNLYSLECLVLLASID